MHTKQQPQKTSELTLVWLAGVKGRQTTRIITADAHSFTPLLHTILNNLLYNNNLKFLFCYDLGWLWQNLNVVMLMCLLISNLLNFVPKPLILVSLLYTQGLQLSDLCAGSWTKFSLLPPIQQILNAFSGPFCALLHKSDHNFSHYYSLSDILLIWHFLNPRSNILYFLEHYTQASIEAILSIFLWTDHHCMFKSAKQWVLYSLFTDNSPQSLIVQRMFLMQGYSLTLKLWRVCTSASQKEVPSSNISCHTKTIKVNSKIAWLRITVKPVPCNNLRTVALKVTV